MTNKKEDNVNADVDTVVSCPELENIFQWEKEQQSWSGQYYGEGEDKIPYERPPNIEQMHWENFVAKCKDPNTQKWFKSGLGSGSIKPNGEVPRRFVTAIIRLKTKNGEYLLSNNRIVGYNQWGDPVISSASLPEKYQKTNFRFESRPNMATGYSMRMNVGPSGSEIIYTTAFTKENATKLFEMREKENDDIQFIVKSEEQGKSVGVKPQITVNDTLKLFVDNSFEYLYNALYIPTETKMLNMKRAEGEGLIDKQTDDERNASLFSSTEFDG